MSACRANPRFLARIRSRTRVITTSATSAEISDADQRQFCLSWIRFQSAYDADVKYFFPQTISRLCADAIGGSNLEFVERHVLVDLVNRCVCRSHFDDFRAERRDKACIGSAATCIGLRGDTADLAHRCLDRVAQGGPSRVTKASPDRSQSISKSRPCRCRIASVRSRRLCAVLAVQKRKLNAVSSRPGTTLSAPVPALDIGNLERGRWERVVAFVPARGGKFGQGRRGEVDRVAHLIRVGDVTLYAAHAQMTRAATRVGRCARYRRGGRATTARRSRTSRRADRGGGIPLRRAARRRDWSDPLRRW